MNTTIEQLRQQIERVETGGRAGQSEVVSSGCAAVDRLLSAGGYARGTLVQWIGQGGCGMDFLSLKVAQQACQNGGALVVVDPHQQFFPSAAAALGINLEHLIVLTEKGEEKEGREKGGRPQLPAEKKGAAPFFSGAPSNDLLWAIDQSLRCPAVAAVWGPLAELDERWFRRFQLAAESSGCLGLFVQPLSAARKPTWAEVQWLVSTHPSSSGATQRRKKSVRTQLSERSSGCVAQLGSDLSFPAQHVHLQLTRCRGTYTGKSIQVAIDHVTGDIQPIRPPVVGRRRDKSAARVRA